MLVGDSPRTPASANQVSRYLPPSRATWRSQEVLGWVPGQRSQSRGGQSSLTWAGQAAGAGRKARRARGSAAREPQRSGAALAAGPTRQSPTQRERCGAATQQADRRARSVDVPGTRALSGATEHPGKRSPVPPCAAHRALTQLRALRPPGSGCGSSKRRSREGLPAPGAPRLHRSSARWPRDPGILPAFMAEPWRWRPSETLGDQLWGRRYRVLPGMS